MKTRLFLCLLFCLTCIGISESQTVIVCSGPPCCECCVMKIYATPHPWGGCAGSAGGCTITIDIGCNNQ